jgi:hypothetical protein
VARPFNGLGQLALMLGAGTRHAAGKDLAALGQKAAQTSYIFVIDIFYLIHAKGAYLSAALARTRGFLSVAVSSHGKSLLVLKIHWLKRQFVFFVNFMEG